MRSRRPLFALLAVATTLATAACSGADTGAAGDDEDLKKSVSTKALVQGNDDFAADLYGELASGNDNVFFSPYSISAALAMTYAGARGQTAAAMKGTMHLPTGNVHAAFKSLGADLAKRAAAAGPGHKDDGFQLSVANSLWGEKTQHFETEFTRLLSDNYGAGMQTADFKNNADKERVRINGWVEDNTNDKIKDLLPQGILKSDTRLVLVNAIYFKASWERQFTAQNTQKEKFATLDGRKVDAQMMSQRASYKYADTADYEAVAMPYLGGEVELVAVAPKAGKFESFERSLGSGSGLDGVYSKLEEQRISLHFPKFKIEGASVKLKDALTKLGMGVAFTNDADLSGITGKNDSKIADVVHKAFIDLDEKGTEAAAATAVIVIGKTAVLKPPPEVRFDRPFVFAIRDVPTGSVLFLGRVTNPGS